MNMNIQNRQDYFESVYRETFKRLSQYVFFKVASISEAEDIVAAVYTDYYRFVVLRDKRPDNPLAYLTKMANHELSRHYSSRQPQVSLDDEQLGLSEVITDDRVVGQEIFDHLTADELWQAVRNLSLAEQQVIIAKFRFDLTFIEIARSLGQPESTVKLRYYRALKKLKKNLI